MKYSQRLFVAALVVTFGAGTGLVALAADQTSKKDIVDTAARRMDLRRW